MSLLEWIDFAPIVDARGALVAIEGGHGVPFDIRRIYYLYGMRADAPRGFHAHRDLVQVAVCLSGSCRFVLDDGARREDAVLDRPDRGLIVKDMVWHEMHDFSADCVLLMLASDRHQAADYIRDYGTFLDCIATNRRANGEG